MHDQVDLQVVLFSKLTHKHIPYLNITCRTQSEHLFTKAFEDYCSRHYFKDLKNTHISLFETFWKANYPYIVRQIKSILRLYGRKVSLSPMYHIRISDLGPRPKQEQESLPKRRKGKDAKP